MDSRMEVKLDGSNGVNQGQKANHCCMGIKFGGWSYIWMLTTLKVSSKQPGVTQGQIAYHCCMHLKPIEWSHLLMLNILKISSKSSEVTQGQMV